MWCFLGIYLEAEDSHLQGLLRGRAVLEAWDETQRSYAVRTRACVCANY